MTWWQIALVVFLALFVWVAWEIHRAPEEEKLWPPTIRVSDASIFEPDEWTKVEIEGELLEVRPLRRAVAPDEKDDF